MHSQQRLTAVRRRHRSSCLIQGFRPCKSPHHSHAKPHLAAAAAQQVVQGSSYEEIIDQLASSALEAALQMPDSSGPYIVGIAGGPGSGKSTLAQHVMQQITAKARQRGLSRAAAVAPMDGFHLYKHQLQQMPDPQEAFARRGAPWTFDGAAFVAAVSAIRHYGAASLPSFDHAAGDPVEGDISIDSSQHCVVLVEGNYLFLSEQPWLQLRPLLDDSWFVDCPLDTAMQRVFERQTAIGLPPAESRRRIESNDRPNGQLVIASKGVARLLVPSSVPFAAAGAAGAVGDEAAAAGGTAAATAATQQGKAGAAAVSRRHSVCGRSNSSGSSSGSKEGRR